MDAVQLEKLFKSLENSKTPALALKRNYSLTKFIISNTCQSQLREDLLNRKLGLFLSVLDRLGA